jgi:hypothetical protein
VGLGALELFLGHFPFLCSMSAKDCRPTKIGAHHRNRTDDLTLTKGVLYRLS